MWAAQTHEMFVALTEAGFTESQALIMIIGLMGSMRQDEDWSDVG